MKKYQIIFHVDLNAFYASCEASRNPALKNHPVGIAPRSDRGILTTANYAARRYGVNSAMNVIEAKRRCPHIKIVPPDFALYETMSSQFFERLRTFTDQLEPASIDEGYMDMTEDANTMHPIKRAEMIQKDIMDHLSLPLSIGIGPNKFLAKMASDMKKPLGITVLRKRDVKSKMWPLPIEQMHGIGRKTVPNLKLLGIHTIGDLATYKNITKLSRFLGNQTESFIRRAYGDDDSVVDPSRAETVQSIGNSKTYDGYLHTYDAMLEALEGLTKTVVRRLHDAELACKTITVQVRFSDFTNHSKQLSRSHHTERHVDIIEAVEHLFDALYDEKPVSLLGVSVGHLEKATRLFRQLNIFEPETPTKTSNVDTLLERINAQYDKPLLKKGFKSPS